MENSAELIGKVEAEVARILLASPACHDWEHTCRVRKNALEIAAAEGADLLVVELAALLHDIGRPVELADCGKTDHAALGAEMVPGILCSFGVHDAQFVSSVAECVRTHRYRKRSPEGMPVSLEAKCVFDADKLDSIGAIGIGRAFHFAGRTGAKVHNSAKQALTSQSYSREDTAYREYLVKLRHINGNMLTGTGRRLARSRHAFMQAFFDELNSECGIDGEKPVGTECQKRTALLG